MKLKLLFGKRSREGVFAAITVAVIVVFFLLNLLMTHLGIYKTVFIDLTPEGLYTVTERMKEECEFIDDLSKVEGAKPLKITFCSDPDVLMESTVLKTTYFMAIELHNAYPYLEVETVNVALNPSSVDAYRTTSLSVINSTDVIVSYGNTYRVASAESFWATDSTTKEYCAYNGEYRLASLLLSVTAKDKPMAYFIDGHGETVYDKNDPKCDLTGFVSALADIGLGVGTLNLSTLVAEGKQIPDDCKLLIINNPKTDYITDPSKYDSFNYISELELIDRYLLCEQGALMVAKDYRVSLPVLEEYLAEWGIGFSDTLVKDEEYSLRDEGDTNTKLVGVYDTDETGYGYAIYGDFADLSSSPRMIISDTGYIYCAFGDGDAKSESGSYNISRNYAPFILSSAEAKSYAKSELSGEYVELQGYAQQRALCATSARMVIDSVTSNYSYSYVFAAGSADFFSNKLISEASYANYDIVSALAKNMSRTSSYASGELGGESLNSSSYGGKQLVDTSMSDTDTDIILPGGEEVATRYGISLVVRVVYAVVIAAVPVAIAIVGTCVYLKRKFK
ncbi:MAG: Gldg family protein [Clostridia bacterium]|nr:Gldg family protein [Clostridia bacterium]